MNGKMVEEVDQFKNLGSTQTKDGTSIKGSGDQTGAGTPSHDKASNTIEKQRYQFSYED